MHKNVSSQRLATHIFMPNVNLYYVHDIVLYSETDPFTTLDLVAMTPVQSVLTSIKKPSPSTKGRLFCGVYVVADRQATYNSVPTALSNIILKKNPYLYQLRLNCM